MATLRKMLDNAGFCWDTGVIVWQDVTEEAHSPGWAGEDELKKPEFIDKHHAVLDTEFDASYGAPRCPRFVAKDHRRIFFPVQYDGSTTVDWVCQSLTPYMNGENFPYPGG